MFAPELITSPGINQALNNDLNYFRRICDLRWQTSGQAKWAAARSKRRPRLVYRFSLLA
jgi:hypothetical protein